MAIYNKSLKGLELTHSRPGASRLAVGDAHLLWVAPDFQVVNAKAGDGEEGLEKHELEGVNLAL